MTWQPIGTKSLRSTIDCSIVETAATVLSGSALSIALKTLVDEAGAGDVLRVMSPVIDDPDAVSWLLEAHKKRGVVVHVLTTLVDRHGIGTKGWDGSQNIEAHGESIRKMAKGCNLRSSQTTPHGKFVLFPSGKLWFGSANLAIGSLGGRALEAGMVLNDPCVASQIQTIFDQIWKASPYSMVHRQGAIFINEQGAPVFTPPDPDILPDKIRVWCSAPGVSTATRGINSLLDLATREILLVSMSLYDLDGVPEMQETLLRALHRGVKVRAVVRKEHFESEELDGLYPDPGTRKLLEAGLELLGIACLHAKGFLVDGTWCGIQSANFNPYSLDWRRAECNIELVLAGRTSEPILSVYASWMRHLQNNATHRMDTRLAIHASTCMAGPSC